MFQITAPSTPEPITATASAGSTVTIPAIVSATAVPTSSAPSMLKTPDRTIACPGRAPRVATSVAIAFAASWNPFVNEKANANATANQSAMGHDERSAPKRCEIAAGNHYTRIREIADAGPSRGRQDMYALRTDRK